MTWMPAGKICLFRGYQQSMQEPFSSLEGGILGDPPEWEVVVQFSSLPVAFLVPPPLQKVAGSSMYQPRKVEEKASLEFSWWSWRKNWFKSILYWKDKLTQILASKVGLAGGHLRLESESLPLWSEWLLGYTKWKVGCSFLHSLCLWKSCREKTNAQMVHNGSLWWQIAMNWRRGNKRRNAQEMKVSAASPVDVASRWPSWKKEEQHTNWLQLTIKKTSCLNQIGWTGGSNERQLREGRVEIRDFGMWFSVLVLQYCNTVDL